MSKPAALSATQIAEYDQAYAAGKEMLSQLVDHYEQLQRENLAVGLPEQLAVMALADGLTIAWDASTLATVLTMAVVDAACPGCIDETRFPHD